VDHDDKKYRNDRNDRYRNERNYSNDRNEIKSTSGDRNERNYTKERSNDRYGSDNYNQNRDRKDNYENKEYNRNGNDRFNNDGKDRFNKEGYNSKDRYKDERRQEKESKYERGDIYDSKRDFRSEKRNDRNDRQGQDWQEQIYNGGKAGESRTEQRRDDNTNGKGSWHPDEWSNRTGSGMETSAGVSDPSLPENWHEATSDDGKKYYYNLVTGVTQWEHPGHIPEVQAVKPDVQYSNIEGVSAEDIERIKQKAKIVTLNNSVSSEDVLKKYKENVSMKE
jgi:hypothetical protein